MNEMAFPRRNGRTWALAATGAVVAASLFFAAPSDQSPLTPKSDPAATVSPPSVEPVAFRPPTSSDATFFGGSTRPDLGVAPVIDLAPDPLVPKDFPVGTDSAPNFLPPATPFGIDGGWAVGPGDGDQFGWIEPGAVFGYALLYDVAPPGPPGLQQFGGAPHASQSGARTYKLDGADNGPDVDVPEPGTLALLSVGLLLLGIRRGRR